MRSTFERTIARDIEVETEARKSRFICTLARVATEQEARAAIDDVRKRRWDANHHCTAWRIGSDGRLQRSSDDGEPAGTAGIPMLDVLVHRNITDTLAIVRRYFGGTKLGAGGLIRAYGSAVSAAVDSAGIVERRPLHVLDVVIGHEDSGRVEHALRGSPFSLRGVTYNAGDARFTVLVELAQREPFHQWLAAISSGEAEARETGIEFVDVALEPTGG